MRYKYKRNQIFGKRLEFDDNPWLLNQIYDCKVPIQDYFIYELDKKKIPTSCIIEKDRKIVDKFGIDKCKEIDWKLFDNIKIADVNLWDVLMSINPQTEDINHILYEKAVDKMPPIDYTPMMKKLYSDRLFDDSQESALSSIQEDFNKGSASLLDIVDNWDVVKNKNLSYCLENDSNNSFRITDSTLKDFMSHYGTLVPIIYESGSDIYKFIAELSILNDSEKKEHITNFTDDVLNKNLRNLDDLSNEDYKEIFKYSSLEEFLRKRDNNSTESENLIEELKDLPNDYVFNMHIPVSQLFDSDVIQFVGKFGLKNVVDFDNECGHFFTNDNCEMLNRMYELYLHYPFMNDSATLNVNSNDNLYTKDEFYEAMRRVIVYGPNRGAVIAGYPDYRGITGEFREKNPEIFLSEQAPKELQDAFYTRQVTPQLLLDHPDYIEFLRGKNIVSCIAETIEVAVKNDQFDSFGFSNIYDVISDKTNFDETIDFFIHYHDVINLMKGPYRHKCSKFMMFSGSDDMSTILNKINEGFRKVILEEGIHFPNKRVPKSFKQQYPSMCLSEDAPKELQDAFYSRTLSTATILSNPSYIDLLAHVDLEVLFKYMPVKISGVKNGEPINFVNVLKQTFGSDALNVMLSYGKCIEQVFEKNVLKYFSYHPDFTKNAFLDEIDNIILRNIIDGDVKYDETISEHFKNKNPMLFLNQSVPQDIKDKFYNKELTLDDFNKNPKFLEMFADTNIAFGFKGDISWLMPLFENSDNLKMANYNCLKVIQAYSKIQDADVQQIFKDYVKEFNGDIDFEKIECFSEVLSRIASSNSTEIFTFKNQLANEILKTDNPLESLSKVEEIFIKNNIPVVGKTFSCFEVLHPDFRGFNFGSSMISPVLKRTSTTGKKMIVFSDLIKSSFGSNNQSVNNYLKNIEMGSKLYENIKSGQVQYNSLEEADLKELSTFCSHLSTLYNNTMEAKAKNETFIPSGDVLNDIFDLSKKLSPDGSLDYNLGDRVVRMFCGFANINTLEEAKNYISEKVSTADARNRNVSRTEISLEKGDFVKGIGNIKYLRNILQNGSVSKEYLGASADSDATPLDTDVSMITNSDGTIEHKIRLTAAGNYGPIWFVLKNDGRFVTTRKENDEMLDEKYDSSKMEAFYTGFLGKDHYGIRTGFASSEINYIVTREYDARIGLEIAMNGFYIPVVNPKGEIVFTPEDYDKLRGKMSGLSYFGEEKFAFSNNLITEDTERFAEQIEESNQEVLYKKSKINSVIQKSLDEVGLQLKTNIDGDLTEGFVELIDTGSTGRGTNKPGDGDFDFMMRLDRKILLDSSKLGELKKVLLKNLGEENTSDLTSDGDFRLKDVQMDPDTKVDIDITFTGKTDKVFYSTDRSLYDRLSTIQKNNPEGYKYVVANILLAKQVLKDAEVYKPNRGLNPQGGLGGVGVENWILQNGGSFIDAAKSFVDAAEGKDFSEFKSAYQIWDFGDNHLAEKKGAYPHDEFVSNNMSEDGYKKMNDALKKYLNSMKIAPISTGKKR